MADYSALPSATAQTSPVAAAYTPPVTSQTQAYQYVEKGRGPSGVAVAALIISIIIALILLGLAIYWWYSMSRTNGNPYWTIANGVTSGTADSWSPDGNDIYVAKNPASFTLTTNASGSSLTGRMFMIDNTFNAATNEITIVGGSGVTITDKTGANFKVVGGTSAQLIWLSNTTINRLR